jgi:hypothetical protein
MKKLLRILNETLWVIFLAPVMQLGIVNARTEIPAGNVSGTWTKTNSPYRINGEVIIPDGNTLNIEPGVQIIFTGHYKFIVQGRIMAVGTREDTITFTAQDPETGWQGLRFNKPPSTNDTSKVIYCKLQFGNATKSGAQNGGAIYAESINKLIIAHCLITQNRTSGNLYSGGGGLFISKCSPVIENNIISNNKAAGGHGGGISMISGSNPIFRNNIICKNHATGGGAIVSLQSNPVFINNTIVQNFADLTGEATGHGGAACIVECSPRFINTIIFGNNAAMGKQFHFQSGGQASFSNCDIEGGKSAFAREFIAGGSFSGNYENNIDADPFLSESANDIFCLNDTSPCISTGTDLVQVNNTLYFAPATDYLGNTRPNPAGTIPDMGAIENAAGIEDTTGLSGNVSGTWTKANSPYRINGNIIIPNGSTLTIEPGIIVLFKGSYKMDVKGCVLAVGTVTDTITFTAENPSVGWQSVKFLNTSGTNDTSRFIYCKMEYGKLDKAVGMDRAGGAVFAMNFSKLVISRCLLQKNLVYNSGGDQDGYGGAIMLWTSSPIITDNTIINNECIGSNSGGGAIMCWANSNAVISGNRISGNKATLGGGFYIGASAPILTNNIITDNQASYRAGGLRFYQGAKPVLINNTIAFNKGGDGGGINCLENSDPVFINTILYGNTGTNGSQVCILTADSDPDFVYCTVEGGKEGFGGVGAGANYSGLYENNVNTDPDFVNAEKDDFGLTDDSPCISTGVDSVEVNNTWYYAPSKDYEGNSRPNPADTKPDKGAIENITGIPTSLLETPKSDADDAILFQNYPNPFTSITEIPFSLPYRSPVKLQVLDCMGRIVDVLAEEELPSGEYHASFDANVLAEGLYFIQLVTANGILTRKCIKIR